MPIELPAQSDVLGNWMMYFGQGRLSDDFSLHTEAQYRHHTVAPNIEQLLLRTGLRYHVAPTATLLMGYGFISSHEPDKGIGDPLTTEHRIYQELTLNQSVGRINFEHRYRVEQRWVNGDYRNRFRYRLFANMPLNRPKLEADTWFLAVYDEVFIAPTGNVFDRNRIYGALGYKVDSAFNAQVGVLNQQVGTVPKWYLQFAVFVSPDFRKK